MRKAEKALLEMLNEKGRVNGNVIKVDTFLNHLVDISLLKKIGADIAEKFKTSGANKILSSEASGIVVAHAVASEMDIPYVFAKKKKPLTMEGYYSSNAYSFTKCEDVVFYVSMDVLLPFDKVLIIDDFYAEGSTMTAMETIVKASGAKIVGRAVVINKGDRDDVYSVTNLEKIQKYMSEHG